MYFFSCSEEFLRTSELPLLFPKNHLLMFRSSCVSELKQCLQSSTFVIRNLKLKCIQPLNYMKKNNFKCVFQYNKGN